MQTKTITAIQTTSDQIEVLQTLAENLIEERLAACAQILPPHRSIYRWQGKIVDSEEHRLLVKTTKELSEKVIQRIQTQHNYQLPEIVIQSLTVTQAYAQWVNDETATP